MKFYVNSSGQKTTLARDIHTGELNLPFSGDKAARQRYYEKRRRRLFPCDCCGTPDRVLMAGGFCDKCEREISAVEKHIESRQKTRKCRSCGKPTGPRRYFNCEACVGDFGRPSEDVVFSLTRTSRRVPYDV